jgi:ribosomal protein L11 methyltransferase
MKPNALHRVFVTTSPEAEDAVLEVFERVFQTAANSYKNFRSGKITVTAFSSEPRRILIQDRKAIEAGLDEMKAAGLKFVRHPVRIQPVRRENWAHSWKRHFKPMEVSVRLLVKPTWSKRKPKRGVLPIVLDPGLSFGTGQHPTTMFCLRQLVSHQRRNKTPSFLDIGTGSGILAIAAARLGFQPVEAFDFDPVSVRIATANARRNAVERKLSIFRGDVARLKLAPATTFSLVCANLIADLLLAERKRIAAQVSPGGTLVLAGILAVEFDSIKAAYENCGLALKSTRKEKEWRSGAFLRGIP